MKTKKEIIEQEHRESCGPECIGYCPNHALIFDKHSEPHPTPTPITAKTESKNQNPYTLRDALTWIARGSNEIETNGPGDFAYTKVYRNSALAGAIAFVSEERESILRAANAYEKDQETIKELSTRLKTYHDDMHDRTFTPCSTNCITGQLLAKSSGKGE